MPLSCVIAAWPCSYLLTQTSTEWKSKKDQSNRQQFSTSLKERLLFILSLATAISQPRRKGPAPHSFVAHPARTGS